MTLKPYSYKVTCSGSGAALMTGIFDRISAIISERVGELLSIEMVDDESEGYPIIISKPEQDGVTLGSKYILKWVDTDTFGVRIEASNGIEYWSTYNFSPYFNTITGEKYFILDFLPTSNGAIIGVYIPSSDSEVLSGHGLAADLVFTSGGSIFFLDCSGTMPMSNDQTIPSTAYFITDTDSVNATYTSVWKNSKPTVQYLDTNEAVQFVKAFDGNTYMPDAYITRIGPNPRRSGSKNNLYIAYFGDRIFYLTPLTNKNASAVLNDTSFCWAFEVKYEVDEQTESTPDEPDGETYPDDGEYEPEQEEEEVTEE